MHSPLSQFLDFLTHIRLYGYGEFIGEIGDVNNRVARVGRFERERFRKWNCSGTPSLRCQHSSHSKEKPIDELIIHHHDRGIHPINTKQYGPDAVKW